ncbi:MAG: DUF2523 domain-containing protein [Oscillospiraceae bacterium]
MHIIIAALASFFALNIGSIVLRVLASLSLGIITYSGIELLLDQAYAVIVIQYSGLPADLLALFSIAGFGQGISIILSACFIRAAKQLIAHYGVIK